MGRSAQESGIGSTTAGMRYKVLFCYTLVYPLYPRTPPVHVHRMPGAPARGRVPRVLGALVQ